MRFEGRFPELGEEERRASLEAAMAENPEAPEVWVFAYASLLWDRCFAPAEARPARLEGHRRALCVWSVLARGSPERPGLTLGLEPGAGACEGLVYRLGPASRRQDLVRLWEREMLTGIYAPHWLRMETPAGPVSGLAFVVDRRHEQYAGEMGEGQAARVIAEAGGKLGPCRDYLANTVAALADLGIRDRDLEALLARVEGLAR